MFTGKVRWVIWSLSPQYINDFINIVSRTPEFEVRWCGSRFDLMLIFLLQLLILPTSTNIMLLTKKINWFILLMFKLLHGSLKIVNLKRFYSYISLSDFKVYCNTYKLANNTKIWFMEVTYSMARKLKKRNKRETKIFT